MDSKLGLELVNLNDLFVQSLNVLKEMKSLVNEVAMFEKE